MTNQTAGSSCCRRNVIQSYGEEAGSKGQRQLNKIKILFNLGAKKLSFSQTAISKPFLFNMCGSFEHKDYG